MNGTSALNQWAETWAALAWNGLIESTILLGVIALIWLALRRRISSHAAYWLFLLVVIKAMLPLEIRAPQWLAQWTPQQAVIATVERAAPPIAMVAPASPPPVSFPRETAIEPVEMRSPAAAYPAPSTPREFSKPSEPQVGIATVERSQPPLTTYAWLMLAWAVIAGGLLTRFVYNHLRARRYLRGLRPISPSEMGVDYARLLVLSGLRKPVPVYASPHIGSPAAFGLLRPCVIVPEDFFDSLKPEQASWALLHELAHIRRRDLWATAFQRVARIAHFYNPAVWIANWAVDRFREYACDDEALALSGVNRKTCGAGLLNVAERAVFTPKPVAETLGLLQTSSMIRRRLERILDARRVLQPRLSRPALLALILLGAVLLPYVRGIDSPDATAKTEPDVMKSVQALYSCYEQLRQIDELAVSYSIVSQASALTEEEARAVLESQIQRGFAAIPSFRHSDPNRQSEQDQEDMIDEYIQRNIRHLMQEEGNEFIIDIQVNGDELLIQQYDKSRENLMLEHTITSLSSTTRDRALAVYQSNPMLERVYGNPTLRLPWENSPIHHWTQFVREYHTNELFKNFELTAEDAGEQATLLYLYPLMDDGRASTWKFRLRLEEIKGRTHVTEFSIQDSGQILEYRYLDYVEIQPGVWFPSVVENVPVPAMEDAPASPFRPIQTTYTLQTANSNPSQSFNAEPRAADTGAYRLAGSLVDQESGDPIGAGALVQLYDHRERMYGERQLRFETRANAEGRFAFDGVPAGDYWPRIVAEGYKVFEPVGDPRVIDPFERITISAANEGREYAIPLERGQAVEIVALTSNGQPEANAEVLLIQSYTRFPIEGRTDAQGRFLFTSLNGHPAYAMIRKEGFGETVTAPFQGGILEAPQRVEARLTGVSKISGRIYNRDTNEPYAGVPIYASLILERQGPVGTPNMKPLVAFTDDNGQYLLEGLGSGQYSISLQSSYPEFKDRTHSFDSMGGFAQTNEDHHIGVDFPVGEHDVSDSLHVRVLSTEGEPIPGVQVIVNTNPDPNYVRIGMSLPVTGTSDVAFTDENGEAIIEHLIPYHEFSISLTSDEYIDIRRRSSFNWEYSPRPEGIAEFRMARAGGIRGKVIDAETDAPIPQATIQVMDSHELHRWITKYSQPDSNGSFEIIGLNQGAYTVEAVASGYPTKVISPVEVKLGKTTDMEIALDLGAALQGVVRNQRGQPISGAKLHLKSQTTIPSEGIIGFYHPTQLVIAAESGANGAYHLPSIQPDGDVLIVTAPGYGAKRLRLTPETIALGRLDLTLGEGGTIRGRVVGPNDEPQAEVRICVFNHPENLFTYEAITDANGEYELTGLPEANYYVRKWVQPYGEDEIRIVHVREGETVAAGFGTGERVVIEGIVLDDDDSPIPNATVVLDVEPFRSPLKLLAYADDEGRYQFFHDILPGEYLLSFHRPLDPNNQNPPGMLGFGMIGDRGGFGFNSFGTKKEGDHVVRIERNAEPVRVDLQAGERQVSIRVIDSETGESLEGVRGGARMPLDRGHYQGVTNAQGEIPFNVRAIGVYSIVASKAGYVSAHANAKSTPTLQGVSNDDPVEIELQPASAWLKAHLHFEGRIPTKKEAGFKWMNTPYAPDMAYSLISEPVEGESGTMLVSGFPPGSYELAAFLAGGEEGDGTRGWVSAPQSITVTNGQTLTRNFTLYEARAFQLIFRTPDYEPIPQQVEIEIEGVQGDFGRLVDFHTQRDIIAMLPIDRGPARIKFPGYQPVEFTPEDIPTEPYSPIELRFDLKRE